MKPIFNKLLIGLIGASAFMACDNLEDDIELSNEETQETEDIQVAVTASSPAVINLLDNVDISTESGAAQISISEAPKAGVAEIIAPSFLKYTPAESFSDAVEDVVAYKVCADGNCTEGTITFSYTTNADCSLGAEHDFIEAATGTEQIIIDVLANDQLCQDSINIASLTIVSDPNNGNVVADSGLVYYYPNDGFTGYDQFIYSIEGIENPGEASYAAVLVLIGDAPADTCELIAPNVSLSYTSSEVDSSLVGNGYFFIPQSAYISEDSTCSDLTSITLLSISNNTGIEAVFTLGEGVNVYAQAGITGTFGLEYQICDQSQNCDTGVITIEIESDSDSCEFYAVSDVINLYTSVLDSLQSPLFISQSYYIDNDNLCGLTPGQLGSIGDVSQPAGGIDVSFTFNEGLSIYYGEVSEGAYPFDYQICTQDQECSIATITLNIIDDSSQGCAVKASSDSIFYAQSDFDSLYQSPGFVFISPNEIFGNDELCNISEFDLSVGITDQPQFGSVTYYAGEGFRLDILEPFSGSDYFSYQFCTDDNQCTEATVSIIVE